MNITERISTLHQLAPEPTKSNRYLVIPNDAPAYGAKGYGIYDTKRADWINFRDTEVEAYQLLATILQSA
jgi:hypothetical protein